MRNELTEKEREAARQYTQESVKFHTWFQGVRQDELGLPSDRRIVACTKLLDAAIDKFELTATSTVYCGLGWGLPVLGSLIPPKPEALVGFTYEYPGFISTTVCRDRAVAFLCQGINSSNDKPVLLEISLPANFRTLPAQVLGNDNSHEQEFILGRNLTFTVTNVRQWLLRDLCKTHNKDGERKVLELSLSQKLVTQENLADAMRRLVEPFGGFELPPFPREPLRDPPDFT
jgi:ADP-ribosyltransferase exoenzyme